MRKTVFRRLMAGLLIVLLMVSILPAAFAAETGATETTLPEEPSIPPAPDTPTKPADEATDPSNPAEPTVPEEPTTPEAPTGDEIDWHLHAGDELTPYGMIEPLTLAPGTVLTIAQEISWYCGNCEYRWYSDNQPFVGGPWWTENAVYFKLSDGRIGFCTQPNRNAVVGDHTVGNWYSWIDSIARRGISRILAYGSPNNGDTSEDGVKATALAVWDMATGYLNEDGTQRGHGTPPFYAHTSGTIRAKYDAILAKLARHGKRPSFTVRFASQITNAQTIILTYDATSKLYKGSAVDANGVLEDFNFVSTIDGLTFTKNGNILNVQATEAAAKQINNGVTIKNRGHEVEISPDVCTILTSKDYGDAKQAVVILDEPIDPVPCYFKLQAEVPDGSLTITKTSTNGVGSDKQFKFRIYDIDRATYVDRTLKIGESITLTGLHPGLYVVAEWCTSGWKCTNAQTLVTDQARWNVTVPSGGTVTVTANNEPTTGTGKFIKTTNTGENLGGWTIPVYTDEACTQLYTSVVTGEDGTVNADLPVGVYYAKEAATDDPYWVCDSRVVKFEITSSTTTEVRFENTHMGRIEITKQTSDGENLEGWQFAVYSDAECTQQVGELLISGADGRIESANLLPATYWIKEIGNVDPEIAKLYDCPTEAQEITVTAGQTASVIFENVLKTGKFTVAKVDTKGNRLAGATFLLEWSLDGTTWTPVTFSETPTVGGCSTEGIENGSLTTGNDGLITFDGLCIRSEGKWISYRLTETKAPNGYHLLKDYAFVGTLETQTPEDAAAFTVELTVHNSRGYDLPATGDFTSLLLPLLGTLLCLLTGSVLWTRKRT